VAVVKGEDPEGVMEKERGSFFSPYWSGGGEAGVTSCS